MKVLVALKRVSDPDCANQVKAVGGRIDTTGTSWKTNPFDECAIEAALRLTENGNAPKTRLGEVVAVAVGPKDGPAYTSLDLTPAGTWKGTVASFADGGRMYANYVELAVTDSRITGPGVDVTFARLEGGGFRLSGMWMKANVDLTVTPTTIRDQFGSAPALAPGVYGGRSLEDPAIRMTGEAASFDAPRWPHVALAALSAGLGVRTYRR